MKKFHHHIIYVSLLLALNSSALFANQYDAGEIRQLFAFLQQQSGEAGKTNAQAIGLTGSITESNVADWIKQKGNSFITTSVVENINYITDISLENSMNKVRFGGSFKIEKFNHLKKLSLSAMGVEIKVMDCPVLVEFRLMSNYLDEHCTLRRLEIKNCPKLWNFRIGCLVTEFVMEGCHALKRVNINNTEFPKIDFSTQNRLDFLELANNAFSEILVPEAGNWTLNCANNRIEPADLVALIRKLLGDDQKLDWSFIPAEYKPQRMIYHDPYSGVDSAFVGIKIDLTPKATFPYGNPEKKYTGTFKWQYEKTESWGGKTMVELKQNQQNPDMNKGIYTIPPDMRGKTIICTYTCEPLIKGDDIQYIINVSNSTVSAQNPGSRSTPKRFYFLTAVSNDATLGLAYNNGVMEGNSYEAGKTVFLEAKPSSWAVFVSWMDGNDIISTNAKFDYVMPLRDVNLKAIFKEKKDVPEEGLKNGRSLTSDSVCERKPSVILILTSNFWCPGCNGCVELSGEGRYYVGDDVIVSVKAPKEYNFEGWFLGDILISKKEEFCYQIRNAGDICLHAKYNNPPKPLKHPVFKGKYACSFFFRDEQYGMPQSILVTGRIDYRPNTADLCSPYSDTNLGAISFDLGPEIYEKATGGRWGFKQQAGYMAMTIYAVTENEIIASGGGYVFGFEMFNMEAKFSTIHHIPYTVNSDGSITLKNFDLTGYYVNPRPSYPDITFYPKPEEKFIEWYERRGKSYSEEKNGYENERDSYWNYIKKYVMPKVEENLKKERIDIKK